VLGFCRREVFKYDYAPLKGGLYGMSIVWTMAGLVGVVGKFPLAAFFDTEHSAVLMQTFFRWLVVQGLILYVTVRVSDTLTQKFLSYLLIFSSLITHVANLRGDVASGITISSMERWAPQAVMVGSLVAGLIHHEIHNRDHRKKH
jgi:hypothetical protein